MNHEAWSEAQSSQAVTVDGHDLEMAYYEAGEGDTLVFLHGIPTWSFLWRDVATELESDYHVVAPDLVGYGNSSAHEGFDRSIRAQEEALADLLDALGVDSCTLVAHDIGGGVALRLAAHQPERVEKLVCSNVVCYNSWPVDFIVNMGLPKTESMDPAEFEGKLDFAFDDGAYGDADPEFVEGMKAPWLREDGRRALARAAVSTNTNHTTEIDYDAITADLLCLWAEADQMQPIRYGERLAEELGGELERLDEAYHWVVEDREDVYADRVRAFVEGET